MEIEQQTKESPPGSLPFTALLNEQFIVMANSSPVLQWVSGVDKLCFFLNNSWLAFTGRTFEESTGYGWLKDVHPEDLQGCIKTYFEAFDKREPFKIEYRLRHNDGKYKWILDNGVPHFSKNNHFEGYIGSCMDINDLKEIEQKKEQFFIAASHELKTPVTSLNIYIHLIAEFLKEEGESKFSAYAESAIGQINKITLLINQLLNLSRSESGSLSFEWTVFPFCELAASVVKKMQSTTSSHQLELSGNCMGMIRGDSERLSDAIENLLSNAIKFSKSFGKIKIVISEDTNFVKMSVIDFGIGIEKIHLSKIFDRFYRIPGEKEETYPGFGIGLYISRHIINKHGGKIWVESIPGKETNFNFQIPVYNESDQL